MSSIDVVLPVNHADLARAQMAVNSLTKFMPCLGKLWIVHPAAINSELKSALQGDNVRFIEERELVPELASLAHSRIWSTLHLKRGWYIQQVIKLAAAQLVATDTFLTFDADILLTQPLAFDQLIHDDKAIAVKLGHFKRPYWYWISSRILGQAMATTEYGITPALLNRSSCIALTQHLQNRSRHGWRTHLLHRIGWTEYSLYHTYLEATGRSSAVHSFVPWDHWFGPCAWSDWNLNKNNNWSADIAFAPRPNGWFSICSSRSTVSVDELKALVHPYLSC